MTPLEQACQLTWITGRAVDQADLAVRFADALRTQAMENLAIARSEYEQAMAKWAALQDADLGRISTK